MSSKNREYKLKDPSLVKNGSKNTHVKQCNNCGAILRITRYWHKQKKYKNFYCNKKCESKARYLGENLELVGGYRHKTEGYEYVRVNGKPSLKHRIIMERHLQRKLSRREHVHHINGIRYDNRLENLAVVDTTNHPTEALKFIHKLQSRIRELEHVVSEKGK